MNCATCGASLSLEDMKLPTCRYCNTVLPHHARAAEHAALVNQVLAQQVGAQYPGATPPQIGYGYGAPMQGVEAFQQQQMGQAMKRAGWITAVALIVPLALLLLVFAGGVVVWVLMR